MFTVSPKLPGFSAFLVLGLSIGALLNKDYANAAIAFLVVVLDCLRIESAKRATQAAADMGIPISKPVHQFRTAYCADWYDGHPDTTDGKKYQTRVLYTAPVKSMPPLSDAQIASACLSYRHDFGLLPEDERKRLMSQAREWERALGKAIKAA